jgi:GT2 family glycosyltransferase
MNQFAVLLTCFNRKENTLPCLKQLFYLHQNIDVYLVDDNSTDGTGEAVATQFPQVYLIKGTGDLFWNRGMHTAWQAASQKDYDFYLWLNDDVLLYENCFSELLSCSKINSDQAIICGIIESSSKDRIRVMITIKDLVSNGQLNPIQYMNGNVVLVPKKVYKAVGNLDIVFHHDLGDVDYGLRAAKLKIGVFTTRVAIASGQANSICRERQNKTTLQKRFKKLYSPLVIQKINFILKRP